MLGNSCKT